VLQTCILVRGSLGFGKARPLRVLLRPPLNREMLDGPDATDCGTS
jgi:hypothetical protein